MARTVQHRISECCLVVVVASLLSSGSLAAQKLLQQPIALDALPSAGLVVLEASGGVSELSGKAGHYEVGTTFYIPTNYYPVDLTLAQIDGTFYIFVASNGTLSMGRTLGRVWQYSLVGKVVQYWDVKGVCAGIDYDGVTHTVFVGTSDPNGLYSIHVTSGSRGEVSFAGSFAGIEQLGPIAYDELNKAIYASDVVQGGIYKFDLGTRKSFIVVGSLHDITALRTRPSPHQLVAADSRGHVTLLDLSGTTSKVVASFSAKRPSGLAFVEGGMLAVSERDTGVILFYSDAGQLVTAWPSLGR